MNQNIQLKKERISPKYHLTILSFILYSLIGLSGLTSDFYLYLMMACFIFWVLSAIITSKRGVSSLIFQKEIIVLFAFLMFLFTFALPTAGVVFTLKIVGNFILQFSPIIMFLFYFKMHSLSLMKTLLWVSYALWFFFVIISINFYISNPGAARLLASHQGDSFGLIAIGGGYKLAIGSSILASFLFDFSINSCSSKKYKLWILFAVSILTIVVILTWSAITLLGLVVGILFALVIKQMKNKNGKIVLGIRSIAIFLLYFVSIFVLINFIDDIGHFIMNMTSSKENILMARLYDVGLELSSVGNRDSSGSEYISSRVSRLFWSYDIFLESPLIGNGYKYGYDFSAGKSYGIGNHSEWFDLFAVYGLLGGGLIILVYFNFLKKISKFHIKTSRLSYISVLIFLGLFNPFRSFSAHFVLFFIVPATLLLYENDRKSI